MAQAMFLKILCLDVGFFLLLVIRIYKLYLEVALYVL